MHDVPIFLNFIFFLAVVSANNNNSNYTIAISNKLYKFLLIVILIGIIYFIKFESARYSANKKWTNASVYVKNNNVNSALRIYNKTYPVLRYNGNFLYNYGAELSIIGNYEKSLEILLEAQNKINDADYYTYLGNSYEGLGKYNEAIEAFQEASFIIPHKLYPKYRLVYLYAKTSHMEEALQMANIVVNMKEKVESSITTDIKNDLIRFIEVNSQ